MSPPEIALMRLDELATTDANGHWTGYPKRSGQCLSYWLQGVRCDPLLDHRTTPELPQYADTVIIGSGVSNQRIARKLQKES